MVSQGNVLLRDILERLKEVEQVKSDIDLAEPLMTNKRNISAWKERDSIPWERLFAYGLRRQVSLEWLINGNGPIHVDHMVAEPGAIYQITTNQDAVYTLASDIYRALRETEGDILPEKFADMVRLLHRDMLERKAEEVPYEKVLGVVKLAV